MHWPTYIDLAWVRETAFTPFSVKQKIRACMAWLSKDIDVRSRKPEHGRKTTKTAQAATPIQQHL